MMMIKKIILPIFVSGLWITFSEFVRNELLFKSYWVSHFRSIGLEFNTLPINGILWMVWSFALAYVIFELRRHLSWVHTVIVSWLSTFVMMWITLYNLQVLPITLLFFAVPLSLIEVVIAHYIQSKMLSTSKQ